MKKTIFTAILIATLINVQAQISIGGSTGVVISRAGNDYTWQDQVCIPVFSIPINAIFEVPISQSLAIQTGISILRKGASWKDDNSSGLDRQVSYHLGTVEIPALLKIALHSKPKFKFNLLTGIYIGYMTGGRAVFKDESSRNVEKMDLDYYSFEKPVDLGVKLGFQGEHHTTQGKFFMAPTYHIGIKDNDADPNGIFKQRAFMLAFGYLYNLTDKSSKKTSN